MCAKIHYGGRVTDHNDLVLLKSTFQLFLRDLRDNYTFSDSAIYKSIEANSISEYIRYVEGLPLITKPEAFGLHIYVDI